MKMTHEQRCEKVEAALRARGYRCERPRPPEKGVDFIVARSDGKTRKLQVRTRIHIIKKYHRKQMCFAFPEPENGAVCLYDHDKMVQAFVKRWKCGPRGIPKSWGKDGRYHIHPTPKWILKSGILHRIHP